MVVVSGASIDRLFERLVEQPRGADLDEDFDFFRSIPCAEAQTEDAERVGRYARCVEDLIERVAEDERRSRAAA